MKKKMNHGEVVIFESEIPAGAKKNELKEQYFKLADSETLGNDHRLELLEDTEIYELDGVIYVKNVSPTKVFCPKEERHGTVELFNSIWRVNIVQEYDYLNEEIRNVAD